MNPNNPALQVTGLVNFTADILYKGNLLQESSRELKRDITKLSNQEVSHLLAGLNPVKFVYNSDQTQRVHIGFISEEFPDLVASSDKRSVSVSDIVGVLVQAVKEQRQATIALANIVNRQKLEIIKLQDQIKKLEDKAEK